MPKKIGRASCCFKKAAGFFMKYQNMALPDGIKLADFSAQEQACCAKRMVLHLLWKKAEVSNSDYDVNITPPPQLVHVSSEGIVLFMTEECTSVVEEEAVNKVTMIPCICLPIKAAQLCCTEAVKERILSSVQMRNCTL
jgi:hypothetical protein